MRFSGYIPLSFLVGLLLTATLATGAAAQTLTPEIQGVWPAEVIKLISENQRVVPGTDTVVVSQSLRVKILAGGRAGQEIELENDYQPLAVGDKFFLYYTIRDGQPFYTVGDFDRRIGLGWLIGLFAVAVVIFGRWQGVRSLLALAGSLLAIIFILLPWLLRGGPPLLVSLFSAGIILIVAIYLTHGFNRQSSAALLGTLGAVAVTTGLAALTVMALKLSGFATDEAVYLNLGTAGALDFRGLLLGAFIIGMLGVLDDIAITQVTVVAELKAALPAAARWLIYERAIRVGREHVGALVNTLVLAYTGSALPLLLLFSLSDAGVLTIINREVFATEIARTVVGSIGLILTVPISTWLAVWLVEPNNSSSHQHSHH